MGEIDAAVKWSTVPFSWKTAAGWSSVFVGRLGGGLVNKQMQHFFSSWCLSPTLRAPCHTWESSWPTSPCWTRPSKTAWMWVRFCLQGWVLTFSDELTSCSSFGRMATSTLTKGEGWGLHAHNAFCAKKKKKADRRKSLQGLMKVQELCRAE